MSDLIPLELVAGNTPTPITASVILLHGLGADGYDFAPIVKELALPHIRFILPHAPAMPVSLNHGYVMPAWYDIYSLNRDEKVDDAGLQKSQHYLQSLIAQENARGIVSERIVIAGFSQGGAVALHTLMHHPQRLAGVLALSTYVAQKNNLPLAAHSANAHTPVLMAHGTDDEVITLSIAQKCADLLTASGYALQFKAYPMAHSLCAQELDDIRQFLIEVLP